MIKVIYLRLEEQSNSRKWKKWCEKFSKWSEMQQKQERVLSKCRNRKVPLGGTEKSLQEPTYSIFLNNPIK